MNGWTLAALLVAWFAGIYYGGKIENTRIKLMITGARRKLLSLMEDIAMEVPREYRVKVTDTEGNLIAEIQPRGAKIYKIPTKKTAGQRSPKGVH